MKATRSRPETQEGRKRRSAGVRQTSSSGRRRGGPDPLEKVGVYVLEVSEKRALLMYEGDLQSVPMNSVHGLAPIPRQAPGTGPQDVLIRLSKVVELGWLPGKRGALHYIAE